MVPITNNIMVISSVCVCGGGGGGLPSQTLQLLPQSIPTVLLGRPCLSVKINLKVMLQMASNAILYNLKTPISPQESLHPKLPTHPLLYTPNDTTYITALCVLFSCLGCHICTYLPPTILCNMYLPPRSLLWKKTHLYVRTST